MNKQIDSQEQEHRLTRLLASLPRLESSNDVALVMIFLYTTQNEATSVSLSFEAAIAKCNVTRFATILRGAPRTAEGWQAACTTILTSVDEHFMSSARLSLYKNLRQGHNEDPPSYADRFTHKLEVYNYFAGPRGKTVDEEELTRVWISGLHKATRKHVTVIMSGQSDINIKRALALARAASGVDEADTSPLQSLGQVPAYVPDTPAAPAAPLVDTAFLKQMMEKHSADSLQAMESRLAAATSDMNSRFAQSPGGAPNELPRGACAFPGCYGALHRFNNCPNARQCRHCPKYGHHSETCFTKYGVPKHMKNNRRNRSPEREDVRDRKNRDHDRERSSSVTRTRDRDRDRDRDGDRDRDRDRDGGRDRNRGKGRDNDSGDDDKKGGSRLNRKGRS